MDKLVSLTVDEGEMTGPSRQPDQVIRQVAHILRDAHSVLFVTGAGVSADSGLPTYRGVGGLYNRDATEDDVSIEEALSGPMFAERPALTWKYLWQIGAACIDAAPNAAHQIIAQLEQEKGDVWVMTQNIDGLHRAAGSKNLVEVHGNMYELYCVGCGADYQAQELLSGFRIQPALPPSCAACGGIVRPRVVLFEELLSQRVVQAMFELFTKSFQALVAIGTTAAFAYIREPIQLAQQRGIPTVEINPTRTEISCEVQYRIPLGAAAAMQRIREQMG